MMFNFDNRIIELSDKATEKAKAQFEKIDSITEYNQQKMLKAFINGGVSESCFTESTGYGYGDRGRETIDKLFAKCISNTESVSRIYKSLLQVKKTINQI